MALERRLVTQEKFAQIACMDGWAFGMPTFCSTCDYNLKPCLRRSLADRLDQNEKYVERILGYGLTKEYRFQDIIWNGIRRYALEVKGVSAINVKEKITRIGDDFDVSPYILESIEIDSAGGFDFVLLDRDFVDSPDFLIFRNAAGSAVPQTEKSPEKIGGNWKVYLDLTNDTGLLEVDVQHCKYMIVTIPTPTEDDEVVAVHPNTLDIIPFADNKEPVENDNDTTTYWFYAWSMIDKAFRMDEEINLVSGQFYKIIDKIGFIYVGQEEALPVLTWSDGTTTTDTVTVSQFLDNTISVKYTDDCPALAQDCEPKYPVKLRVYYKTDPLLLDLNTEDLADAISYLTAAQLPMKTCNCESPAYGFIWQAQQPQNPKVNGYSGEVTYKYGTLYGELVFQERLRKARNPENQEAIVI